MKSNDETITGLFDQEFVFDYEAMGALNENGRRLVTRRVLLGFVGLLVLLVILFPVGSFRYFVLILGGATAFWVVRGQRFQGVTSQVAFPDLWQSFVNRLLKKISPEIRFWARGFPMRKTFEAGPWFLAPPYVELIEQGFFAGLVEGGTPWALVFVRQRPTAAKESSSSLRQRKVAAPVSATQDLLLIWEDPKAVVGWQCVLPNSRISRWVEGAFCDGESIASARIDDEDSHPKWTQFSSEKGKRKVVPREILQSLTKWQDQFPLGPLWYWRGKGKICMGLTCPDSFLTCPAGGVAEWKEQFLRDTKIFLCLEGIANEVVRLNHGGDRE